MDFEEHKKRFCLGLSVCTIIGGFCFLSNVVSAETSTDDIAAVTPIVATSVTEVPTATDTTEVPTATDTTEVPTATDTTALSGTWQETENGRQYVYMDGSYATGVTEIDGVAYLFDYQGTQKTGWQTVNGVRQYYDPETGEVVTGWITYKENRYYADEESGKQTGVITVEGVTYLLEDTYGYQKTGWQQVDGTHYYYDANSGEAAVGVQEIDGMPYLFAYSGAQKTGWRTVNGARWYYDEESGELVTGWVWYNGYHYYVDEENGKQTGEVIVDDVHYMLNGTYGQQKFGFQTFSDGVVSYYKTDGTAVTGWQTISGSKYYFNGKAVMQTGWQTISGSKYYFNASGVMQTGWQTISGSKYYFNSSGVMQTGFVTISGSKYYFNSSGVMQTGFVTVSGSKYYFNSSGVMQTGWQTISGSKYYFNSSGVMQTGWQTISGKKYYFNSSGVMQTGLQSIGSHLYYFDTNGVMLTNTRVDGYRIDENGIATKIQYPKAVAILDEIGWNLKAAFNWAASLKYYGHTSDMPQDAATGTAWYANYGFTNLKGNCYVMAAVFCEMARELGYDAQQISGRVPLLAGGLGAHSWVEITISGTTYVFDPNFTNETGYNGYQITYGQSGTWRYVRDEVMSD